MFILFSLSLLSLSRQFISILYYFFIHHLDIRHHVHQWQKLCLFSSSIQCVTKYLHHVIQVVIDLSSVKAMQLQFSMQVNFQLIIFINVSLIFLIIKEIYY